MNKLNYREGFKTGLFLIFAILLPYFPSESSMASYNVNFVYFAIVLGAILLKGGFLFDLSLKKASLFFMVLQVYLLLSFIFSSEAFGGISDFGSLLRPTVILLFVLYFYQSFNNVRDYSDFHYYIKGLAKPILFLAVAYILLGFIEFLIGDFCFINLLYKRSAFYKTGIEFSSTTFMGSTYPSAFLGFFLLNVLFLINQFLKKRYLSLICLLLIFIIILSQSKPFILLVVSFYIIYFAFSMGKNFVKLSFFLAFTFILFLYPFALDIITTFLEYLSPNLRAARSMLVIVSDTSSSGTLNTRLEQVYFSIDSVSSKLYLIGAGLGRELYLESWIAEVIFRYGFLGFTAYFVTYLIITYRLYKITFFSRKNIVFFSLFYWFSSLIISELSGLQVENGKTMVLSAFMFSMIMIVLGRKSLVLKN